MAQHTITLSDNAEDGFTWEAKQRTNSYGRDVTIEEVIINESEGFGLSRYQNSVQEKANLVTQYFLAASPEAQQSFESQVIPIAIDVLGMPDPSIIPDVVLDAASSDNT